MNKNLGQIILVLVNVAGSLAWWGIRSDIQHVRELLSQRLDEHERRIVVVEKKCDYVPYTSR